jgi:hypothetical protein
LYGRLYGPYNLPYKFKNRPGESTNLQGLFLNSGHAARGTPGDGVYPQTGCGVFAQVTVVTAMAVFYIAMGLELSSRLEPQKTFLAPKEYLLYDS